MEEMKQDGQEVDSSAKVNEAEAKPFNFDKHTSIADAIAQKQLEGLGISSDEEENEVSVESSEVDVKEPESDAAPVAAKTKSKEGASSSDEVEQLKKARDAERARRKEANLKVRQMEAQLAEFNKLKEDMARLQAAQPKPQEEGYDSANDDDNSVKRELVELKRKFAEEEKRKASEQQRQAQEAVLRKIETADKELAAAKLPGFSLFVHKVSEEVQKRYMEGDYTFEETQDPSTWKAVYADLFPALRGTFIEADKADKMDAKKTRKANASLVGSPGKAPAKAEAEDDNTPQSFDEFVKSQIDDTVKRRR